MSVFFTFTHIESTTNKAKQRFLLVILSYQRNCQIDCILATRVICGPLLKTVLQTQKEGFLLLLIGLHFFIFNQRVCTNTDAKTAKMQY